MIGPPIRDRWLAVLCDSGSATLLAAQGDGAQTTLLARRHVEFDPASLQRLGPMPALDAFVNEQDLRGAPAYVALSGAGTIAQVLRMPPLSARNRKQAIQTRLRSYAAGSHITVAVRSESPVTSEGVTVLAACVETGLARGWLAACTHAGLRVRALSALAGVVPPPQSDGAALQLVLGERTTTMQVFRTGALVACRDVLIGRRDFVQAYQRPILTEDGAVSLNPTQADELFVRAGVPMDQEQEIAPGIRGRQIWPTLDPVLQKVRREVEQSLRLGDWQASGDIAISVHSAPAVPGLAEYLAAELQLCGTVLSSERSAASLLSALRRAGDVALDLRPAEVQMGERLTRPALVAGFAALLTILANTATPRDVQAQLAQIEPTATQLAIQAAECHERRAAAEQTCTELSAAAGRCAELAQALPAGGLPLGALKSVLATVPTDVRLLEVRYDGNSAVPVLELRSTYASSDPPASVVAAQWARALTGGACVSSANVKQVLGGGRDEPSVFLMEVVLK